MESSLPTLRALRYGRNQRGVRAVALFVLVTWISSALYMNCIKPPSAHVAMADCAQSVSSPQVETAKYMPGMEKCANEVCYTGPAGGKESFLIEKLKTSFDFLWLPLAFFCAFRIASLTQTPPFPYFADFLLRKRQVPVIYRFCTLLN